VFPRDGQYVVFVDFWPRGGDQVVLAVPIDVGSTSTPVATLTPDTALTQTVGDLNISLKYSGILKAGEYKYINFEASNTAGQVLTQAIEMFSGYRCNLYIIDEKLTTFLKPEFINRSNLQFSVNFPKPGRYKVWFEFIYANQPQQVSYVLDVK
jgi:hypothetical protein